jgi:hypothetical protein
MKTTITAFLFFLFFTQAVKAQNVQRYYDLVIDQLTMPLVIKDTSIKLRLTITLKSNSHKEAEFEIPVTIGLMENKEVKINKKMVDVLRGESITLSLELTNDLSYPSIAREKLIEMKAYGSFNANSEGRIAITSSNNIKPEDLEKSLYWFPEIKWHLVRSGLD